MMLNDALLEPKSDRSMIFIDNEFALVYLKTVGLFHDNIACLKCNCEMKIRKNSNSSNEKLFRCTNNECRSEKSLYFRTRLAGIKIPVKDILFLFINGLKIPMIRMLVAISGVPERFF